MRVAATTCGPSGNAAPSAASASGSTGIGQPEAQHTPLFPH